MDSEPNGEEEEKNAQNVPGTHDEYKHDEQQEQEEDVEITTGGIRTIPVPDVTQGKHKKDMCTPAAADVQRLPRADYPGRGHDTDQYNLMRLGRQQSNYRSYYGMQR